jgi:hypothetical protein
LGIGTSTPTVALDIVGAGKFSTTLEVTSTAGITLGGGATALSYTGGQLNIGNSASWTDVRFFVGGVQKYIQTSSLTTISNTTINLSTATVQLAGVSALAYSGADVRIGSITAGFTSLSFYTAATEKMRIAATTGNVLINTTTDAGFKLDVNGTARVQNLLSVNGASGISLYGTSNLEMYTETATATIRTVINNLKFGTNNATRMMIAGSNVLIGTQTDVASSLVTMESTTKGFLPPRMTTTQKNAIATPATGLMVYDTTLNLMALYNGTTWTTL